MNYIIYRHTSPSGKVYIGQTCRKPEHRWNNGKNYEQCTVFFSAIQKYGWDNIKHEVLFEGLDQLNANIIEEDLIYYYKQQGISYNLQNGGDNKSGWHKTPEAIEKTRQYWLGRHHSPESIEKMRQAKLGKKQSPEIIEKRISGQRIPIVQLSLDGEFIREWRSATDTSELGFDPSSITKCCRGKLKTCKGYKWKYKTDYYGSN